MPLLDGKQFVYRFRTQISYQDNVKAKYSLTPMIVSTERYAVMNIQAKLAYLDVNKNCLT